MEDLFRKHPSKPHNPNIAYVFYLAGFIETWGRGIEKICEACQKEKVPIPEYRVYPSDIMVKFTAPEDRIIKKMTEKGPENISEKKAKRYENILQLINKNAYISIPIIAKELGVGLKAVKTDMRDLKNCGIIERVGTARGGYWKIT